MRVICYVRVSTREQAEKGYSVGEQQERLRAYCMAKDWIVEDVITDPGFSGAKLERPGIQRVIQLVQEKNARPFWSGNWIGFPALRKIPCI